MKEISQLQDLDSRHIGEYRLHVEWRPVKNRSGWTHFSIYLKDRTGRITTRKTSTGEFVPSPVLDGIHSRGGKGIKAWIEVGDYFPVVHFDGNKHPEQIRSLPGTDLISRLLQMLTELIPPGGHLMFAYDVPYESSVQRETAESLLVNVPPVCTPLGKLLFDAGFRLVKDWYLAEGGYEGPRKLWGEKPPGYAEFRRFDRITFFQVLAFSTRRPDEISRKSDRHARKRALEVLSQLRLEAFLSAMRQKVVGIYSEFPVSETCETAALHVCQCVNSFQSWKVEDDMIMEELKRIAMECSADWLSK